MKLKIALLQIMSCDTLRKTLKKGIDYCIKAKECGADIVLFPEMWSNGYQIPENPEDLEALAIAEDDEFVLSFGRLAEELDMAIAITFLEKRKGKSPRNTVVLFDRKGKKKYTYAKVHTCVFGEEARLTPGDDFYVVDLDTRIGNVKVGSMICYDREFPESARVLMLKGAEVILVPNACPMEVNRLSQLRGRAYENMLAIATCNYPQMQEDCNGHSSVFDGVAYLPELPESRDTCILEADGSEGIFIAELDMEMLRKYREREVHGNAFRRPDKYEILLSSEVKEPFVRVKRNLY